MAKTDFTSVDEYIASQPEGMQPALQLVRRTIRKAVPDAEEAISYQIPTFKLHGTYLIYLAGYKQHYSLYPVTDVLSAKLKDELAPHLSGKGTMRFALSEPVPVRLIERIAKLRAREVAEHAKGRPAAKRR